VAALWLAGSIETFMYGIGADDPWTIGAIALLLAAVATGATLIPARAAARLDPARVLRTD
jgi:ABC-type lipoprotein release transport system permease subunit